MLFIDFAKQFLRPSSTLTLCALLTAGILWLWRREGLRSARSYLTLLVLAYWFAATPAGARALLWPLRDKAPRVQDRAMADADTVVVLGGGAITANVAGRIAGSLNADSLLRVLEGARAFEAIGAHLLIVSGGVPYPDRQQLPESAMLRDAAVRAGVPASAIVEESTSRTTHDEALAVGEILRRRGVGRFVLVTGVPHMRRALAVFRSAGLNPIASPAPLYSEQRPAPPALLPNDASLGHSDEAIYEYAAWAYYWSRGWVGASR